MWTCPRCDRSFGRANRPHVCAPAMPIDFWLGEQAEPQRRAAEAVLAVARRQPGLTIEALGVGVQIKRERSIVELRPRTRWLQLSFVSTPPIASPRITRTIAIAAGTVHIVRLHDQRDVDGELRGWLRAALRPPRRTR